MSESPDYRDESELRRLYIEKDMTMEEIADRFDVGVATIYRWMEKKNIERGGGKHIDHRVPIHVVNGHIAWIIGKTGSSKTIYIHRLLAVAEYGFDAVCGMDVHHKNEIKWDNRPSNLKLLTREEHNRLHANKQWAES